MRLASRHDVEEIELVLDQKETAERLANRLIEMLHRGNTKFKIEAGFLDGSSLADDVAKYMSYLDHRLEERRRRRE
jgi:hypothetical protein